MPVTQPSPMPALESVVQHIFETRCITRHDQQQFMIRILSAKTIAPQEQALVNRVFDALRLGQLRVVD